jgi:putative FmdB family regulatory protein
MPTYQYRCTACGHDLEAVQKFSDAALTECPSCGGSLRKVFNAVGVVFKGSGFYRTDSRNGASGNGAGDGTGSGEKAGAGEKKKKADGEAKPSSAEPAASKANGAAGGKQPVSSGVSTGGSSSS